MYKSIKNDWWRGDWRTKEKNVDFLNILDFVLAAILLIISLFIYTKKDKKMLAYTAILIIILNKIVALNIPLIGKYVTDIVEIVEKSK